MDEPRDDLASINGFLGRLATLSGFLTGGGIYLLTDWTLGLLPRIAVGVSLCSFALALKGMETSSSAQSKRRVFRASAGALVLALALAMIGLLIR